MSARDGTEKGSRSIRALAVLEAVTRTDHGHAAFVSAETGLPKATVHRLLSMLRREGFLVKDINGRGLISGPRLTQLAHAVLAGTGARALRHRVLVELAESVGETCNITVPEGSQMIYLDRAEAQWPLRLQLPIGSHVPLHCTASGKLYLSSLPERQRRALIARLDLAQHTPNTLTDPEALEQALRQIQATGVGVDDGEFLDGMVAIAVPLTDDRGRLSATLAVHAPSVRMSLDQAKAHAPALRRAAAELSGIG